MTFKRISSKTIRKPNLKTFLKWLLLPVTIPLLVLLVCVGLAIIVLGLLVCGVGMAMRDTFDKLMGYGVLPQGFIGWLDGKRGGDKWLIHTSRGSPLAKPIGFTHPRTSTVCGAASSW